MDFMRCKHCVYWLTLPLDPDFGTCTRDPYNHPRLYKEDWCTGFAGRKHSEKKKEIHQESLDTVTRSYIITKEHLMECVISEKWVVVENLAATLDKLSCEMVELKKLV